MSIRSYILCAAVFALDVMVRVPWTALFWYLLGMAIGASLMHDYHTKGKRR